MVLLIVWEETRANLETTSKELGYLVKLKVLSNGACSFYCLEGTMWKKLKFLRNAPQGEKKIHRVEVM